MRSAAPSTSKTSKRSTVIDELYNEAKQNAEILRQSTKPIKRKMTAAKDAYMLLQKDG